MKVEDFLKFDKMITPTIITIIYFFLAGASIIGGIISVFGGLMSPWGGGMMVFLGLLSMILGPIWARVTCEIMIVLFKINENLTSIDKNLKQENHSI